MIIPSDYADQIKLFLSKHLADFENKSGKNLFSLLFEIKEPDLSRLIETIHDAGETYLIWSMPEENLSFIGFKPVVSIGVSGPQRLLQTEQVISGFEKNVRHNWAEHGHTEIPLFLGGMKFAPGETSETWAEYSDSNWFIPNYLFLNIKNQSYLLYNFINQNNTIETVIDGAAAGFNFLTEKNGHIESHKLPGIISIKRESKKIWSDQVEKALRDIEFNKYQKIVLSRMVEVSLRRTPGISLIINELSAKYPGCYIFAFRKGDSVFFGASPERLAKVSDGWVYADALAGSIGRGGSSGEDNLLARTLLSSEKNLNEQNAVVNFIVNSFSDFTDEIIYDKIPVIKKLPNIQHLWTPIKGKLKSKRSLFSILKEIHPTPAICGVPWSVARSHIASTENFSRGLFTGVLGWFNFECEAEFAVAIRSALMNGSKLYAFAGCGIVNGSDPESEYLETELKLNAVLSLFKNEDENQSKHTLDPDIRS